MAKSSVRLAEVLRAHGEQFLRTHRPDAWVRATLARLRVCRSAALGGHLYVCEDCGRELPMYNSCRDKHCPSCQSMRQAQWREQREAEWIPVPYFHVVFTLPHPLNALIQANPRLLLGEFFAAVNWVLQRFGADPQWKLEGQIGWVGVLHTWTQKLLLHYHIHALIPGGAWDAQNQRWRSAHPRFLFGHQALAKAFRARFLRRLRRLRKRGKLRFAEGCAPLAEPVAWDALLEELESTGWIVYVKGVCEGSERTLGYLARYTHKVAISDSRLVALDDGQVSFRWRDRTHGNELKLCRLPAEEFLARFVQHILPPRFRKIRYYGWLSPGQKNEKLAAIRQALGVQAPQRPPSEATHEERVLRLTGIDVRLCPFCRKRALAYAELLPKIAEPRAPP